MFPETEITAVNIAAVLANHGQTSNKYDSIKSGKQLWHQRLTHEINSVAKTTLQSRKYGIVETDEPSTQKCPSCVQTEQTRTKSTGKLTRHSITANTHADICGLMKMSSHNGNSCFLTMTMAK